MKNRNSKKSAVDTNTVSVLVTIDTDDDFKVNDSFYLEKELDFKSVEDMKVGVFAYFDTLKFKSKEGSEYRLEDFLKSLKSEAFKEAVSEIGDIVMQGTPHEWKIDEANVGGNQTVKIKML